MGFVEHRGKHRYRARFRGPDGREGSKLPARDTADLQAWSKRAIHLRFRILAAARRIASFLVLLRPECGLDVQTKAEGLHFRWVGATDRIGPQPYNHSNERLPRDAVKRARPLLAEHEARVGHCSAVSSSNEQEFMQ
jgi:hypothetical protein